MKRGEVYRNRGLFRMRNAMAAGLAAALALTLSATAQAAMIMVDSLADPSAPGRCTLHDAITAANTKTKTNGCAAGTGNDTILFHVTGTINLADTLPQITDTKLTMQGPAVPGITIDGGGKVTVMEVASGATVNLNNLTIAHGFQSFVGGGGGGIANGGTLTVSNSTFSDNHTFPSVGGGIFNAGTVTVSNSTFSGNFGDSGGGIYTQGRLTVSNSTFSGNSASDFGAGGGIANDGTLRVSIKSTILAANTHGNCAGTITDAGYNISDDDSCGFARTGSANNGDNVNPLLSPAGLANNGGPTKTIALLSGSPAIDAIPLANCTDQARPPHAIITDQRGFKRPDAGEANCDIGAYEFQDPALIPFSSFSGSLTIDPDAGVFYLSGGFKLHSGARINPPTQAVAFSVGSYAVRLPVGSFVKYSTGYVSETTIKGIFLRINLKFTNTPGTYQLLAYRNGGTLPAISPMLVTLIIGNNGGSTQMKAKFY